MPSRIYDGKVSLDELNRTCESLQRLRRVALTDIQGRIAQFDDDTKANVNIAQFVSKPDLDDIDLNLKFVKKEDATVQFLAQMAAEGRTQLGGPGKEMNVFMDNAAGTILIFGKKI